jgi:aminoglycoside phosphotransferase family enzyme
MRQKPQKSLFGKQIAAEEFVEQHLDRLARYKV